MSGARVLSTRLRRLPSIAALGRGLAAEAAAQLDRLFLWVPVAFGLGAAIYLGLKDEPALWPATTAALGLGAAATVVAWRGRARTLHAALVLLAAVAAGFAIAKLRSDHVAAPIVPPHIGVAEVEGYVVDIDTPSQTGPRLLIAPTAISHLSTDQLPLRVRIVMPTQEIATPGAAIRVLALLDPPPSPAAPGAYDFARDAWFAGEGAVGLARGSPELIAAPPAPWRLRLAMAINAFRWRTAERLAADMDKVMGGHAGDAAGLAVAVTTSHQDWLSQQVRNDLRAAGLAHMLAGAKVDLERYRTLVSQNSVAKQTYDDQVATVNQGAATVASDKAAVETARINLVWTKVTAPITGKIGISTVTKGALVTATQTTALSTIQRLDPIYVDVTQSAAQVLALRRQLTQGGLQPDARAGAEVHLTLDDGSTYPLPGRLQFTDITVDPTTDAVTLRAIFPNPSGLLLPGMFLRATVIEGVDPAGLLVPQQGVARDAKGGATALVVDARSVIELRRLQVSQAIGNKWLVTSGLAAGDRVVVEGTQSAQPGMRVHVVPADNVQ